MRTEPSSSSRRRLYAPTSTPRPEESTNDTPLKSMFKRDDRFESHGCVRVENPRELGALLLGEPAEAIDRAIAQGSTSRRMLPKRLCRT